MAATPIYPFGPVPTPGPNDDPRAAAIDSLLAKADMYGDKGDSTEAIRGILGGVDMGRAGRAQAGWDARTATYKQSGDQYATGLAAALAQLRKSSGGGGGGGYSTTFNDQYDPNKLWDEYLASLGLSAPSAYGGSTKKPAGMRVGGDRAMELAARDPRPRGATGWRAV